jgi:hypothetical protein
MRLPAFLLALCLAAMVGFGAAVSSRQATTTPSANIASPQSVMPVQFNDDTSRMWRRAEILVIPLEQVERNRVALESLRSRVAQAESNKGKSPTALAVEQRLNQLEGQTMCEGCHSGIVAQNHGSGIHAAQ